MNDPQTAMSWTSDSSREGSNLIHEIVEQVIAQQRMGATPRIDEYLQRFPQLQAEIRDVWSVLMMVQRHESEASASEPLSSETTSQPLVTRSPVESLLPDSELLVTGVVTDGLETLDRTGAFIGRYRIQRQLGRGGFGTVYLAEDTELDRLVAIKLPHHERMYSPSAKRSYLLEARTLARLDHPNIVTVYDFGMMTDGRCFVVSKYVEGQDLSQLMKTKRFSPVETAQLVSTVAEALHYVHQSLVVHRDIKPANILMGQDRRVFVADFGLALAEHATDEKVALLGTPSYMSPEQIRREGHRVDGRSDQFSLGVVMYELLTGDRPFQGRNSSDVMQEILGADPIPPVQVNTSVPVELSRICMKLLSRLASDRYQDMQALASDLRRWQELESINERLTSDYDEDPGTSPTQSIASGAASSTLSNAVVIPRGLRAFSHKDAYFFMDLVPGMRDRDGIPESLSHWIQWVNAPDHFGQWHRAGVISGPTGCGKSSLVRAGLIPLLDPRVTSVIVEATPDLTEKHLLSQLERWCLPATSQSLPELVMQIRRGNGLRIDKKLLIIIDQFEQWLHGNPDPLETDLLQAVRQCDGKRVQCLLLIRDDFWLALTRFMKAADTPLQLGRNAVMVDLFDLRHARKVLIDFGRGYGTLPPTPSPLSRDQERFIDSAIQSLMIDNKVIPVQLSLFAEMIKSRDWTLATLQSLGGSVGVGSQFLSESFSVTYAPANQRVHEEAAKSVLKSMLPKAGTDIKTCRRTIEEIRSASGYVDRDTFNSLMTILESELKLITATDSFDRSRTDSNAQESEPATYQLSHDFLVPSIRDWLSAQQKATWRGRMEQTIAQQAEYWSHNRQSRFLPSFSEWLQALLLIPRYRLDAIEREMLKARDRLSLLQMGGVLLLLLVLVWAFQFTSRNLALNGLISRLRVGDTSQVGRLLEQIDQYGAAGQAGLKAALDEKQVAGREAFLLQLGQVAIRPELKPALVDYALHHAELPELVLAWKALRPYASEVAAECWKVVESAKDEFSNEDPQSQVVANDQHLHALVLLAALEPDSGLVNVQNAGSPSRAANQWEMYAATATKIAARAAARHPNQYSEIVDFLRPISGHLIGILGETIGHPDNDSLSFSSLSLLRDFTQQDTSLQTSQCLHAAKWQRPYIVPSLQRLDVAVLKAEFASKNESAGTEAEQKKSALRRAMAATLLLLVGERDVDLWSILRRSSDLTSRSLTIQLVNELNVPLPRLEQQLLIESDAGVLAALLQILGSMSTDGSRLSAAARSRITSLFTEHPDGGVHSSALWCLNQWNDQDSLGAVRMSTSDENRSGPTGSKHWLLTPSGILMLKVPDSQSIGREFLISAHEITIDQFRTFSPGRYFSEEFGPAGDCPANIIKWKDAVEYCNWLSQREGFEPFYPTDPDVLVTWQPSGIELEGTGYRLPQENEWHLAAKAGTNTERPFGIDTDLFVRYDWCVSNRNGYTARHRGNLQALYQNPSITRSKPVGQLLPNEFGLFDVLGNVAEWCNDLNPINRVERAIRGGAAGGSMQFMSTRRVGTAQPNEEFNSNGFRIVRSLPQKNKTR